MRNYFRAVQFKVVLFNVALFNVVLWLCLFMSACGERGKQQIVISGSTMGTTYNIKVVVDAFTESEAKHLQQEVDLSLQQFNQVMSTYIPDSEISKINQSPINTWLPVSEQFMDVLLLSQKISSQSQGAFDVTVGPLVNLWGFGPSARAEYVPSDEQITEALGQLGFHHLELDADKLRLRKSIGLAIDLSAVAKGEGVDHIAQLLSSKGYHDYMVEIGGELYLEGKNANGKNWRIGIVSPEKTEGDPAAALSLSGVGMATSGDYRNYYEEDGVRYSHTIDPVTGRPITHKLASVTVIAKASAEADAWATAFSVMGGEKAIALANKLDLAIYIIEREGTGFVTQYTPAFTTYLPN